MKIVIWQSVLTEHQVHTLRALQTHCEEPIEFVIGTQNLAVREKQGWTSSDFTGLSIHELPHKNWWKAVRTILHLHPDAIHLFGGLWADRRMFFALLKAQTLGIKTGLITEPYADASVSYFGEHPSLNDRLKTYLRPIAYRLGGWLITRSPSFVFAISGKAIDQFEKIGFKANHIFPFGYFVPQAIGQLKPQVESAYTARALRLIFVGSLISRKGLAVLVEAIVKLNRQGLIATLDLYGSGDPSAFVSQSEHVRFKGLIPFGKVQPIIAAYDILILPSLHDGWGVVVNEALLQGVPVITSDAVGASTLIEVSGAGAIFTSGDSSQLAGILSTAAHNPSTLKQWQEAAFNFKHTLQPEVAGSYMHECLQYAIGDKSNHPVAPWYLAH